MAYNLAYKLADLLAEWFPTYLDAVELHLAC